VVVVTGSGRGFCAGLDLVDWGTPPEPGTHPHMKTGTDGQAFMANLTVHLRETPQVVVAAVNGPAFGGGLALACAADVRIAASSARFCSAFIRTGLTGTDIGISYLLPRLIGNARAFDLILSGREIDAVEAERYGLVSQVVADEVLLDHAVDYASIMAGYTRTGLLMTKEVLWHNVDTTSMTAAIAMENRNQNLAGRAADVREYMASYRNRTTGGPRRAPGAVT
jgi:enoyl-CoA hydratase